MLVEYSPPVEGAKRADVVLAGSKQGVPHIVVVELKQWSSATRLAGTNFYQIPGASYLIPLHPVEQADSYKQMISHYLEGFNPSEAVVDGCAYLHNGDSRTFPNKVIRPSYVRR